MDERQSRPWMANSQLYMTNGSSVSDDGYMTTKCSSGVGLQVRLISILVACVQQLGEQNRRARARAAHGYIIYALILNLGGKSSIDA